MGPRTPWCLVVTFPVMLSFKFSSSPPLCGYARVSAVSPLHPVRRCFHGCTLHLFWPRHEQPIKSVVRLACSVLLGSEKDISLPLQETNQTCCALHNPSSCTCGYCFPSALLCCILSWSSPASFYIHCRTKASPCKICMLCLLLIQWKNKPAHCIPCWDLSLCNSRHTQTSLHSIPVEMWPLQSRIKPATCHSTADFRSYRATPMSMLSFKATLCVEYWV